MVFYGTGQQEQEFQEQEVNNPPQSRVVSRDSCRRSQSADAVLDLGVYQARIQTSKKVVGTATRKSAKCESEIADSLRTYLTIFYFIKIYLFSI